jgi:hypothetical protein
MNAREIVDAWVIPGLSIQDRWVGSPAEQAEQAERGTLLARGAVDRYIFNNEMTGIWTFIDLNNGTVELQDVSEGVPSRRPVATLDHLPTDFEDVAAWARMVVAVRGERPDE